MLKKNLFTAFTLFSAALFLSSCSNDKTNPGWEYMPDMYRGPAVEAYQPYAGFADSLSSLKPVEGTVSRNFVTYEKYDNTPAGYDLAKAEMKAPINYSDAKNLEEAAKLYGIYCAQCHGKKGDGNGILVEREKFLGVPNYADRELTVGSIFHVITYGKGVMGSHAAQVSPDERWQIAAYVLQLRSELTGEPVVAEATEEDNNNQEG